MSWAASAADVAGVVHIFTSMSGMLDLSRDEKAKHFLPRWLREAPTWMRVDLSMMRKRSWNLVDVEIPVGGYVQMAPIGTA